MFPACCFRQRTFSNFFCLDAAQIHMNGAPSETQNTRYSEDDFINGWIICQRWIRAFKYAIFYLLNLIQYIYILELPWQENPANTFMRHTEHWTAVSTLLGLISRAHRDLHHWRSNQQPQCAEAETLIQGLGFMQHISDAELTSHGELRDHFEAYVMRIRNSD